MEPFFDKNLRRVLFFLFGFVSIGMPLSHFLGKFWQKKTETEWVIEGLQKLPGCILEFKKKHKRWPESLQELDTEKLPIPGFNFTPASIDGLGITSYGLQNHNPKISLSYQDCLLSFTFSDALWRGSGSCKQKDPILTHLPVVALPPLQKEL